MNKELKVGIIGVIGLVFFYLGSNFLKGIDFFSPINRYYAVYENVDGLIVANPVIVNGYTVGRVSNINILQNKDNKILVSMDIDEDLIIGKNSIATLSSNDFLGSKAIILNIGDDDEIIDSCRQVCSSWNNLMKRRLRHFPSKNWGPILQRRIEKRWLNRLPSNERISSVRQVTR